MYADKPFDTIGIASILIQRYELGARRTIKEMKDLGKPFELFLKENRPKQEIDQEEVKSPSLRINLL